jgi:hypothetical protein
MGLSRYLILKAGLRAGFFLSPKSLVYKRVLTDSGSTLLSDSFQREASSRHPSRTALGVNDSAGARYCGGRWVCISRIQPTAQLSQHALFVKGWRDDGCALCKRVLSRRVQVSQAQVRVRQSSVDKPQERRIAAAKGRNSSNAEAASNQVAYHSLLHEHARGDEGIAKVEPFERV